MILVTGATGFTGSHFMQKLMRTDEEIRCFVRESSDMSHLDRRRVDIVFGSLDDRESFRRALKGADILVNIASIGFGHAPMIVEETGRAGIDRAVFVSTTAIFTTLPAKTKAVRMAAEQKIMDSTLNYTILRPTMIYGTERDRNMARLLRALNRFPAIPIAGNGKSLQQPIYVEDLAEAILKVIRNERTFRKAYNVSGKHPLTYNEVIDQACAALNRKVAKIHLPVSWVLPVVAMYNRMSRNPKIKVEQILRLNEDKAFPHDEAVRDFGFTSRPYEEGIRLEVERMKSLGLL